MVTHHRGKWAHLAICPIKDQPRLLDRNVVERRDIFPFIRQMASLITVTCSSLAGNSVKLEH